MSIVAFRSGLLDDAGVAHGFFSRQGGVSEGIYASLNCGYGSSDSADLVRENRARVAASLGAAPDAIITLRQTHSAKAAILDAAPAPGMVIEADAIVTSRPGLAAAVLTADCAPVLFADPGARVVAAAHAGWRGALGGVLEATVAAMVSLGASPGGIRVCVGPCISSAAYEVGEEFMRSFIEADVEYAAHFSHPQAPRGKPHFDLPGFVAARLTAQGLSRIELMQKCTYENESIFYSYRRSQRRGEGDYGRQISAILVG